MRYSCARVRASCPRRRGRRITVFIAWLLPGGRSWGIGGLAPSGRRGAGASSAPGRRNRMRLPLPSLPPPGADIVFCFPFLPPRSPSRPSWADRAPPKRFGGRWGFQGVLGPPGSPAGPWNRAHWPPGPRNSRALASQPRGRAPCRGAQDPPARQVAQIFARIFARIFGEFSLSFVFRM